MPAFIASKSEGRLCIIGAPFDSTVSFRPGSRFGPPSIRQTSFGLETYSPIQKADLEDVSFCDHGDLDLPFGNPEPALKLIEEKTDEILASRMLPVLLGGEHLVSLGAIRASAKKYKDLKIIHLDAHADLRDDYQGQKLSHATVIRRAGEIIGFDSIKQIGIRSMCAEEAALAEQLKASPVEVIKWASGSPCYITCDLDALDTSVFPGTGTPEPGGMSFNELIEIMMNLIANVNVLGLDLVELAPALDSSGTSSIVAAKILRECLLALSKGN